jgi:hypothetical protein
MGDATNMIFMAVGNNHGANALVILAQIAGIRQNNVDAMHAIAGEGKATVNQHQVIAILKHTGIFANLMQSPQGNHAESGLLSPRR